MNSLTYRDRIAQQFGNERKEELRKALTKLSRIIREEIMEEKKKQKAAQRKMLDNLRGADLKLISNEIGMKLEMAIEKIKALNDGEYLKVLKIVNACRFYRSDWIPITIIDDYLWISFWNFAENPAAGIIFDEERDYQFFKVLAKENEKERIDK